MDALEQVGRRDVAKVERWVLPHQHSIDVTAEVEDDEFADAEGIAGSLLNGDLVSPGIEPAVLIGQRVGEIMIEFVPARLRTLHQRKRRIA